MTAGRLQLATTGIQDAFLTGSPDITYFQQVYKKHTKFALETLDNVFYGTPTFGGKVRGTVERRGDLIRNIFLRIELSDITSSDPDVGYTDSIGHALIDYADLIIGGQTIQRINGEYMEIYTEMFVADSQQRGVTILVGDTGTRTGLGPATTSRTFFVLIPFYFVRSDPLSIPLSALTRQEVEVELKFKPLDQLVVSPSGTPPADTTASIIKATLPVEYVFLNDDEISYLQNSRLDYVITQLQMDEESVPANTTEHNMRLNFINPVKEMYIVIQNASNVLPSENDWFNYTNPQSTDNQQIASLKLDFNNETFIDDEVADAIFLYAIQPMNRHTRVPTRLFYTYSFALDPENYLPTGQVNMSRIQNKLLTLNLTSSTEARNIRVYAKSYNILRVQEGLAGVLFIENNLQ